MSQIESTCLNKKQVRAIHIATSSPKKAVLILAGAGTGKTTTLSHCVGQAICDGVNPDAILLLTFTRRAAFEMKERSQIHAGVELKWSGTFHSIACRLLRIYGPVVHVGRNFTFLDQSNGVSLIASIRNRLNFGRTTKGFPSAEKCLEVISWCRSGQKSLINAFVGKFKALRRYKNKIIAVAAEYDREKSRANVLDFDDLLERWLDLLSDDRIGKRIRQQFQFVFVDEYQDLNRIQAAILKKLRPSGGGLVVVGDDAQAIFGFRSPPFNSIVDFQQHYSMYRLVKLSRNYRSTMPILAFDNAMMAAATDVLRNPLRSTIDGSLPGLTRPFDFGNQAIKVVNAIQYHPNSKLSSHVVLVRTMRESVQIVDELNRREIKFVQVGGEQRRRVTSIYSVVAILSWIENRDDFISGGRALRTLRGVNKNAAERIARNVSRNGKLSGLSKLRRPLDEKSKRLLDAMGLRGEQMPWRKQLKKIIDAYLNVVDLQVAKSQELKVIQLLAKRCKTRAELLAEIALGAAEPVDEPRAGISTGRVTISTIHSAKGCEWDHVHIINAIDGLLPSDHLTTDSAIANERRVLHVALTRARLTLEVYAPLRVPMYSERRAGQGATEWSQFLSQHVRKRASLRETL